MNDVPEERLKISGQDELWLHMDRPNNLMVIDTVMWFLEIPDWDKVTEIVQERLLDRFPVFSRKMGKIDGDMEWVPDPDFDLARHVRRISLDEPADVSALRDHIASQRSVAFDKDHPLWTVDLISPIHFPTGDTGAAMFARFHHAIADGVRLTQVALGMCDLAEEPNIQKVGGKLRRSTTPGGMAKSAAKTVAGDVGDIATSAGGTAKQVATSPKDTMAKAFGKGVGWVKHPERVVDAARAFSSTDNRTVNTASSVGKILLAPTSVNTVWSGEVGVEKGAGWAEPLDLDEVKLIKNATGTTVNDVLLCVVAGALARYLAEHGDNSVEELTWMIPLSIKPMEAELPRELGNHFALVVYRMELGIADHKERLARAHAQMDRIKNSHEALVTFGTQRGIAEAPPGLGTWFTNFFADKAVGVLTNVPGPRQPMTLAGTQVEGVLGWVPGSGNQPLGICLFSYNGRVNIGFSVDAGLVPDVDRLREEFAVEWEDMKQAILG